MSTTPTGWKNREELDAEHEERRRLEREAQAEKAARDLVAAFGFLEQPAPAPVKRKSKTAGDDHSTSKSRVLVALRAAGTKGIRTDALRVEAKCSHPGGRVCDLRKEGYDIRDTMDVETRFSIYTLVSEPT